VATSAQPRAYYSQIWGLMEELTVEGWEYLLAINNC
jgi:hypothetical protein